MKKLVAIVLFLLGAAAAGQAQSVTGEIERVWVDHDTYNNGEKGMMIHVKFSVNNMRGRQGSCNAWFYFKDGTRLKNTNSRYGTTSGYVSVYDSYTPGYDYAAYNDYRLFMPYSELHLANGEHDMKFYVGVFDCNNNQFAESDWYYFSLTTGITAQSPSRHAAPTPVQPSSSKNGAKTIDNKDGSKTIIMTADCTFCACSGSQNCMMCNGSGQKAIYGYPIYYIKCPGCDGGGKVTCTFCFGAGYKTTSSTYFPDAPPAQPLGGGYVAPLDGGAGGSVGSSSTTCKGCRGTGSCGVCYGTKYRICGGCGGSGVGASGSCGGCRGAGKNACSGCGGSGNCGTCYGSGTIRY